MTWVLTSYSAALFGSALITGALTYLAWRNRDEPAAVPAAVLLGTMCSWAFVEGLRLGFDTLGAQLVLYRIGFTFALAIPTAWFAFALAYAGYEQILTRRVIAMLAIEPIGFALLLWTNSFHNLVWHDLRMVTQPVPHLAREFALGYYVHITYVYVLVGAGIVLLLRVFWEASAIYRRQTGLLVIGALLPLAVNVSFTLGLLPVPELDVTPLTFALSGIVFGIALFKFELLNLTPVAQAQLPTMLGSGLIVVNTNGRVTHINDTARQVFPEATVGSTLTHVLEVDEIADFADRTVEAQKGRRFYDAHISDLRDFRGRIVGNLIALQDVTERREYEQRLEVANRLLRHNLRNDTSKLVGWADQIQELSDDETVTTLGKQIETVAWEMSDMSEKAQYLETTLAGEFGTTDVNLTSVLEEIVSDLRTKWPDADLSLDVPEDVCVRAQNADLLEVACRNVIENGLEHNDADTPCVRIRTYRTGDGDRVVVEVADNGPGIPEIERETLRSGTETPLRHSGGLGLWIAHWIIDGADGELGFEENQPRGSVIRIQLEPASPSES